MVFIQTNESHQVIHQHFRPERLSEEQKKDGFFVNKEDIPKRPEAGRGERYILYYKDGEFWYEKEERPLNDRERIEDLEDTTGRVVYDELQTVDEKKDLRQAIDTLILDNLMRK